MADKNIEGIVSNLTAPKEKARIKRDNYAARAVNDPQVREYGKDAENYNDDEISELSKYIFDAYQFDEDNIDKDEYQGFIDHLFDNYGDLNFYRGAFGKPYSKTSNFLNDSVENQLKELDLYLNGVGGYGYDSVPVDREVRRKLYSQYEKEGLDEIKNAYKTKYNRDFTGSDVDFWIDRAHRQLAKNPNDPFYQNLAKMNDEQIKQLIDIFGFKKPKFYELYFK